VRQAIEVAILVVFVLGSVSFVGNGILESRRGRGHPVLRWMRNLSIAIVWPLILVRALL
jgi:hypothetical protein